MTLWWIGNALFLLVIIPVVVLLLHRLREPVFEIGASVDDILEHGVLAIAALDAVDELVTTREQISLLGSQVARYGAALDRIL